MTGVAQQEKDTNAAGFPNKATEPLQAQRFPRQGRPLLERCRNSSVSQESERRERSAEKEPHSSESTFMPGEARDETSFKRHGLNLQ